VLKENIRIFADLYLETNYSITDLDLHKYICKALGFGLENVEIKDVRDTLAELSKEGKLTPNLVINDLAIYDKVVK
jgi:hypothetical protein